MIKCTNCEEIFETENDLSTIVEKQELIDGEWHSTDRFILQGPIPEGTKTVRYEFFMGCPNCMSDEYLMDVELEPDWRVGPNEYYFDNDGNLILDRKAAFNFDQFDYINVEFLDENGDAVSIERFRVDYKTDDHIVCVFAD